MKILVIGGTGFIGTHLVNKLVQAGHQVVIVARGQTQVTFAQVPMLHLNRKDIIRFQRSFYQENFDAIYDLVAYAPRDIIQIGAVFPYALRYIMVSTAAVYGAADSKDIGETTPPAPIPWHDYGRNKLLAEQELVRFPHLAWIIVRPCVVYGPGDTHEPRASYFFKRISHDLPLVIPGNESIQNNDVYVEDLAELLLMCLQMPPKTIVNAAGIAFTWPEYVRTLAEAMGKSMPSCKFLNLSLDNFRRSPYCHEIRFDHNAFYDFVLNTSLARKLGWLPRYSLRDGLANTWQWFHAHPARLAFSS